MTVKELKRFLEGKPDNTLVFLSSDEEGNGFNPLYEGELVWMDMAEREIWSSDDEYLIVGDEIQEVVVLWP